MGFLTSLGKKEPKKVLGVDKALLIIEQISPHMREGDERLIKMMMQVQAVVMEEEYALDAELSAELKSLAETIKAAEENRTTAEAEAAEKIDIIKVKTQKIVDWFQGLVDRINDYLAERDVKKLAKVNDQLIRAQADANVAIFNAERRKDEVQKVTNFFAASAPTTPAVSTKKE